jgi:hypothetical protein
MLLQLKDKHPFIWVERNIEQGFGSHKERHR